MNIEVKVGVTFKHEGKDYQREYNEELFVVTIKGHSTKQVEEKVGKLQEAITHMGWELADPEREYR